MFKKRILLGIILTIIFLVFSINGFTEYYKYTQESGDNFYVGIDDKADALEDTNEMRQIIDDFGRLLGHSKRDDLYPKNGIYGGYLGCLNSGLDTDKPLVPVINDMYLATDTTKVYRCFVFGNWLEVYPGAAGTTTFLGLTDTPSSYAGKAGEILRVNATPDVVEFSGVGIETTLTVGSDAKVPTSKAVNDFCETTKNYMQNLEEDITPELGEDLSLNFHNILMYGVPSGDHSYYGLIESKNVGEAVVFGDLLYFYWTNKTWKKADADLAANMPGLRIALESREALQSCEMLIMGYIKDDSWNFTAAIIYASTTAGGVTSTAPSAAGQQLQRVGIARASDILFFDPSIDVGEIKP